MSKIGYTLALSNDSVVKIEIIDEYEIDDGYVYIKPTNSATYTTKKYNILYSYDVYGNKIERENCIVFNCDQKIIDFVFDLETSLHKLREKIFFNILKGTYGPDKGSQKEYKFPHFGVYKIYVKKDDIDIKFSGMQYIYNRLGYIVIEFFHINGIKEGVYKVSNTVGNYNLEITFCNDVETNFVRTKKLEYD